MRTEAKDIAQMLALRMDALCAELLPNGKRDGHEWRCGSLSGEPGQSLAVRMRGGKAGVWKDFSSGECGDALDLVAMVLYRGDIKEAIRFAKGWLGISEYDDRALATAKKSAQKAANARAKEDEENARVRREIARKLWMHAGDKIERTPVAMYLACRAIDISKLARMPRALRFASECYSAESKRRHPAMVACIVNAAGEHVATHRTYLAVHANGRVTKAPLEKTKAVIGSYAGGYVPINRGKSGKPISQAPADDVLVITEGIEDALSVALAVPEYRIIAAVSLSNMANIHLPSQLKDIVIAADNDGINPSADRALDAAVQAFMAQGRRVRIARSRVGKDFNDWQMAG